MHYRTNSPVMGNFFDDIGHGVMTAVRFNRDTVVDIIGAVKGATPGGAVSPSQDIHIPAPASGTNTTLLLGVGAALVAAYLISK